MNPFDFLKQEISETVPFARHAGVELVSIAEGEGVAKLAQRPETMNHIGSQHAGALFTLGEAASGAAMAGGFLPVITSVRPVAADAAIKYVKVAKGDIEAVARIAGEAPAADLLAQLESEGKIQFAVDVDFTDATGAKVASMRVDWHVSNSQ